ncbi:unnamed protein product [Fusarium graminearum]|uniref:Uncharacterized protein n=1 Tax=Gibberella zeae TaxID=5518 RepID=A0A9N8NL95_GIBZA|nr:unnamed protein product [Fusarium graminearum]
MSTLTCLPPHFTSRTIGSLTDPERDSCPQPGTSDRQHPGLLSSGRPDGPQLPLQVKLTGKGMQSRTILPGDSG